MVDSIALAFTGVVEVLVIVLVILVIIFGSRAYDIAGELGKAFGNFQQSRTEIEKEIEEVKGEVDEVRTEMEESVKGSSSNETEEENSVDNDTNAEDETDGNDDNEQLENINDSEFEFGEESTESA